MKNNFLAFAFAVLGFGASLSAADLTLWYQQPAADNKPMDEALPIGNGRMGALVFGSPERGTPQRERRQPLGRRVKIRRGNYDTMGAYQVLGNIFVNLPATRIRRTTGAISISPTPSRMSVIR